MMPFRTVLSLEDNEPDWFYRHAFTLDPGRVDEAWELLATDEWEHELAMLPAVLHGALIKTLKERRTLEQIEE